MSTTRRWQLLLTSLLMTSLVTGCIPAPDDVATLFLARFDADLVGTKGETATASGGATLVPGILGNAVRLGNNGYVRYPVAGNLTALAGTVEFWVDPDATDAGMLFSVGGSGNNGMRIELTSVGLIAVQTGDNPSTPAVEVNFERFVIHQLNDDAWHHVAVIWDGNTRELALFVDGNRVSTNTTAPRITSFSTTDFTIGVSATPGPLASIDDFRISNRIRTDMEVALVHDRGRGVDFLTDPRGMAMDASSRIIVAETGRNRVWIFNNDGTPAVLVQPTPPLRAPRDVAVASSGQIVVADTGNARIATFSSTGVAQATFGAGILNNPQGIGIDPASGKIYVADTNNNRVVRFSSAGVLESGWSVTGLDRPTDVAVRPGTNDVFIAHYGKHRLDVHSAVTGAFLRSYRATYRPLAIAFDALGDVLIGGEDPNEEFPTFAGRLSFLALSAGDELVTRHYTGGLDDVGRVVGGVAASPAAVAILSDTRNGRIVRTPYAFLPPISNVRVSAYGNQATFTWTTASAVTSELRYGPTASLGSSASVAGTRTQHTVTVNGLTPNTRMHYRLGFVDRFTGGLRLTPPDVVNTGTSATQTQFTVLKAAGVIYPDTNSAAGYAPLSAAQIQKAKDWYAQTADFYWRNSGFKLWLDIQPIVIARDVNVPGPQNALTWATTDLPGQGFGPANDFDLLMVMAASGGDGNFGGGGSLFGRSVGTARFGFYDAFVVVHEVNHAVDSIYSTSGLTKYHTPHGLWAVLGNKGTGWAGNGQLMRSLLPANYPALLPPYTKRLSAPDVDGDGVPASSPAGLLNPISITEGTIGSTDVTTDFDGDLRSDYDEARALTAHGTSATQADSDADGKSDAVDPNPGYRVADDIARGTPTIDGVIGAGEGWTTFTNLWGYSNDILVGDSNDLQGTTRTYLAWNDNFLYVGLRGPSSEARVEIDGDADGWFFGPSNYSLVVDNTTPGGLSVSINVGVPDLFRQVDDDGQFSEVRDTWTEFTLPYLGPYAGGGAVPGSGLGFPGRLVTEANIAYAFGGTGSNRVWEIAIPWSGKTAFRGTTNKKMRVGITLSSDSFVSSYDRLFETDELALIKLVN